MLDRCMLMVRDYNLAMRRIDAKLSSIHGLSFSDFMILYQIKHAHGGRLRRIDLAEGMGLTASAVTKSLLPLEKIGLVERQSDDRDARVSFASLTPSGEELFAYAQASAELSCEEAVRLVLGEAASVRPGA